MIKVRWLRRTPDAKDGIKLEVRGEKAPDLARLFHLQCSAHLTLPLPEVPRHLVHACQPEEHYGERSTEVSTIAVQHRRPDHL